MKLISAAFVSLFLCCFCAAAFASPYVIDALDVRLTARDGNSYLVTETYEVTFNARRHGIQRDLPLRSYRGGLVDVREVSAGERRFSARKSGGYLTVRIGDPLKWAGRNERYTLSYVYDIGDDGMKDMDELYYNLIADYDVPINEMTFTVEMPRPFDAGRLSFTHGLKGAAGSSAVDWRVEGAVITGRLKKPNQPHGQMTIALPLPEGYYRSAAGRAHGHEKTDVSYKYLWLVPLVAAVNFLLRYFFSDGRRITPTVEFYPPEGVTPVDAAYIMKGKISAADAASLIIYWAGKGYLSISEAPDKKEFTLRRLRDMGAEAKPYEKKLFDAMFALGSGGEVTAGGLTKGKFYGCLSAARAGAVASHKASPETRIFCGRFLGFRRRTGLGLKYLERLTGFRTFLETAERGRIDTLANENSQYFYDVLPYAAALDVTDTWAEKFEHLALRPPKWYGDAAGENSFSASSFASELSAGLRGFAERPSAGRRSSGGGGSSGGGSGGGRGGSW